MSLVSIDYLAMKETFGCHDSHSTPFHKNHSVLVYINKSILTPHLQEPELWVHHVDVSSVKTAGSNKRLVLPVQLFLYLKSGQYCPKNNIRTMLKNYQKQVEDSLLCCSPSTSVSVFLAFLFRVNRHLARAHTHTQNPLF